MEEEFLHRACAILRRIHARVPFAEVAAEILQSAVDESASDYGSFVRVDWEKGWLKIVATAGRSWTKERAQLRLQVGVGITGKVALTGKTYCCDNVAEDPNYVAVIDAVKSEVAIPVIVEDRVWGIINLDAEHPQRYRKATILRMELLAEMVASAIGFRLQMEKERELSASLMEAEKLSAMGHLVAGIAHEVNNPLAAILGCAELLREQADDSDMEASMEVICAQAKRAGDLVRQLLSFARIGSPDKREVLTMGMLISEVADMVRPTLKMAGIKLDAYAEEVGLVCEVNRVQIQQLLVNLINNAQQAMVESKTPGGVVALAARGAGDRIEISVSDNGPGLTPETQKRIFDPFFTTKAEGKGTGLGLSISRDIAHSHEGELTCRSPESGGCVFSLLLPRSENGERAGTAEVATSPAPLSPRELKILVIDDEAPIRWMLKRLVSPLASICRVAQSAEEGLDFAGEYDFDFVVSDFHLPGIDGIELYERLSRKELRKFVLITGDSSSPRVANFARREGVAVLEKPFELEQLLSLLDSASSSPSAGNPVLPVALPG